MPVPAPSVRLAGPIRLLALALAAGLPGWTRAQTSAPASGAATTEAVAVRTEAELEALLADVLTRHELPGIGAAVVHGSGPERQVMICVAGARIMDGEERIRPDDRFHLGSCSKAMTATLLARLVEAGKIQWTTTLGEVFPDLKDVLKPEHLAVTVEQLLQHRSGLPDDRSDMVLMMKIRGLSGPLPEQRRAIVKLAFTHDQLVSPGGEMAYSNAGYIAAGAMAEQVTGQSWEDLMRTHVFGPLGMETAGFGPPGTPGQIDQPRGHGAFGGGSPVEPGTPMADNPASLGPAGTVHASLADWAKFGAAHLAGARREPALDKDGRPFLKPETFERLQTPPEDSGYALGWGIGQRADLGRTLAHAGSNTMWLATILIAPERDCVLLVATNSGNAGARAGSREVLDALTRGLAK